MSLNYYATIQKLRSLVGKKLIWTGFDEREDKFYLFFEGLDAIAVDGVTEISNGQVLANVILDEKMPDATEIFALKKIVESAKPPEQDDTTKPEEQPEESQ